MPSKVAALAVVALLVLAGCASSSGTGDSSPPATTSTNTSTPREPPQTTMPRFGLTYEDLPSDQQRLVRTAIRDGSVTANVTAFGELSPREVPSLWYDGEEYALAWRYEGNEAKYALADVDPVDASAVEGDAEIVDYSDLTDEAKHLFAAARSGGGSEAYAVEAFPEAFVENDYVGRNGSYYRLRVVRVDLPVYRLTAAPAE